jgi:hypothetical protein
MGGVGGAETPGRKAPHTHTPFPSPATLNDNILLLMNLESEGVGNEGREGEGRWWNAGFTSQRGAEDDDSW